MRLEEILIDENADIRSHFCCKHGDGTLTPKTPGSYYYENADGGKFLVFAFEGYDLNKIVELINNDIMSCRGPWSQC